MKDITLKPEAGWNLLLAVSLIAIIVTAWFQFGAKRSSVLAGAGQSVVSKIDRETLGTEASATISLHDVRARTWDLNSEVLGSHILNSLTQLSQKNHLQVAGFRIGKTIAAANLQEAPFVVIVEGGFMDVMNLVRSIEDPSSKVVIHMLKLASDSNSDRVTATIGLTGFLYREGR